MRVAFLILALSIFVSAQEKEYFDKYEGYVEKNKKTERAFLNLINY